TSTYMLALPPELKARRIHPTFHINLLRRHEGNDDILFPHRESLTAYDFGEPTDVEFLVEDIIGHRWTKGKLEFQVRWVIGEVTWEPLSSCNDLEALDDYLSLARVDAPERLPRRALNQRLAPSRR
ncbi:hypothetical protein OE88DRAFT_1601231, partial [Heliocybe sulcata]